MVQGLKIDAGNIRLAINDDPDRIIEFDPNDVLFVEKFYRLIKEFDDKRRGYLTRAEKLEANDEKDETGLLKNAGDRLDLLKEVCKFMREQIDEVFGEGTSQAAFGDAYNIEMIQQFFEGITPYIEKARAEKIKKYSGNKRSSAMK